jgi:hypothetical protein
MYVSIAQCVRETDRAAAEMGLLGATRAALRACAIAGGGTAASVDRTRAKQAYCHTPGQPFRPSRHLLEDLGPPLNVLIARSGRGQAPIQRFYVQDTAENRRRLAAATELGEQGAAGVREAHAGALRAAHVRLAELRTGCTLDEATAAFRLEDVWAPPDETLLTCELALWREPQGFLGAESVYRGAFVVHGELAWRLEARPLLRLHARLGAGWHGAAVAVLLVWQPRGCWQIADALCAPAGAVAHGSRLRLAALPFYVTGRQLLPRSSSSSGGEAPRPAATGCYRQCGLLVALARSEAQLAELTQQADRPAAAAPAK